jgi:hypothetical protein
VPKQEQGHDEDGSGRPQKPATLLRVSCSMVCLFVARATIAP